MPERKRVFVLEGVPFKEGKEKIALKKVWRRDIQEVLADLKTVYIYIYKKISSNI